MPEQSTPEHPQPGGCCAPQKPNTTLPRAHVSSKATYLALLEAGDLHREQLWQPPLQLSRPRGTRCVPQASWMEVQAPKIEVSKAGGRGRGHRAAPPTAHAPAGASPSGAGASSVLAFPRSCSDPKPAPAPGAGWGRAAPRACRVPWALQAPPASQSSRHQPQRAPPGNFGCLHRPFSQSGDEHWGHPFIGRRGRRPPSGSGCVPHRAGCLSPVHGAQQDCTDGFFPLLLFQEGGWCREVALPSCSQQGPSRHILIPWEKPGREPYVQHIPTACPRLSDTHHFSWGGSLAPCALCHQQVSSPSTSSPRWIAISGQLVVR